MNPSQPPPSYEDVTKGIGLPPSAPSAPPPMQGFQQSPPLPAQGAPYQPPTAYQGQAMQVPYGQPGYSPSSNSALLGGGASAYPQHTYNPVQAGVSPAGGYQYTVTQPGANPASAGFQTTPLICGPSEREGFMSDRRRHKRRKHRPKIKIRMQTDKNCRPNQGWNFRTKRLPGNRPNEMTVVVNVSNSEPSSSMDGDKKRVLCILCCVVIVTVTVVFAFLFGVIFK